MRIAVLYIAIAILACGCRSATTPAEEKQYLDASGIFPLHVLIDSKKAPRGVIYKGFKIDPMPGSRWSVRSPQDNRRALWGIEDKNNRLHSIIGMVSLSDPLPEMRTLREYQTVLEKRFHDENGGGRMKEIHFNSWIAERNGENVVEFEGDSIDTGSNQSGGASLKLFIRGFSTITESGRILYAAASERTPDLETTPDTQSANVFLDAVHWEK